MDRDCRIPRNVARATPAQVERRRCARSGRAVRPAGSCCHRNSSTGSSDLIEKPGTCRDGRAGPTGLASPAAREERSGARATASTGGHRALKRPSCALACIVLVCWALPAACTEIATHCLGSGPLIYLIGGGPAFTTWNLQPVQARLSSRFRVCRWDMRGVGENARLSVDERVPALSQWLEDMSDVIPHEPVVLWGHSWGALQATLFARRYPRRVGKLVLSNPVDPALRSLAGIEDTEGRVDSEPQRVVAQ